MLAISAAYYDDFISVPPAGSGTAWGDNNANTGHGVLVVTIDGTGGSDDVFMRVINGNYQIGTSRNFATGDLVTITHPGYTAPSVAPVTGAPGGGTFTIGTSIASNFSNLYRLQTANPVTTATPVTPGTSALFTSTFSTILVRTTGLVSGTDTPTFEIIGASQNFTKSLLVDLNDDNGLPITGSSIVIGAPVNVAESGLTIGPGGVIADDATPAGPGMPVASPAGLYPGGAQPEGTVLLRSESITVSSFGISVNAGQPIYMVSQLGAGSALNSGGININGRVSTSGQFLAEVIGTGFNVNAGGQVSSGAAGLAQSVVIDATDADVRIPGKVLAANQYYFMQASQQAAQVRTISTRSPLTGSQQGKITADQLIVYLANENDDVPTPGVDGVVDLQTSTNTLRITSSTAAAGSPLQNVITIVNDKSMVVDAVAASSEDISLSTTAGTIDLQAAIVTDGGFSLSSFASLTVASSISSARNISLTSTTGGVTTVATIQTANAATLAGEVTIIAKNDVQIDSLVNAEYEGVTITSQAGKIFSGTNLAVDPTSRVTSPSATLSAVTGINLGTAVGTISAAVTGTGAISIDDNGAGGYAAFLTVNSATTAAGSVAIKSAQTVDVMSLVAGGTGDASITSTGGNVNLIGTVIADGNAVTLTAADFAADGTTVLASGLITGSAAPIANEINWTANNVVGDAADVAITASSYIGLTQTFETTDTVADGDIFYFSGPAVSVPDGFTLGTAYYVINFTAGAPNTFQLSLAPAGAAAGGAVDLAGPIGLEPGNTDLYRNIPVVSAYRLSSGDINFVADDSTTLKAIKTTAGDVNVSSTGGSIVATSVVAEDGGAYTGSVTLDAVGGGVTLGSVATTSLVGIVSVFAAQGIADDGNAATTGITANTVNLSAGTGGVASDIGSAASRVTVAGVATGTLVALTVAKAPVADYPDAIDASSVYVGASSGLTLNAAAVNLVDVKATGAATDVGVLTMTLSDADGKAVVSAGRNLTVGNIQVAGGAFGDQSSISLEAGGRLVNTNGVATATVLDAHALTLKASTFDGSFSVTNLDTFTRLTAAATAAGGAIDLAFDRAKQFTLDGITTVGGNVVVSNAAAALTLAATGYDGDGAGPVGVAQTFATTDNPVDGTQIYFAEGSVIPDGFSAGALYYIVNSQPGVSFQLADSLAGAAIGGATSDVQPMTLESDASLLVGAGGITAGTATSANTVNLATSGRSIGGPTNPAEATGTIFAASSVTLSAADEITGVTKAGQLVASAQSAIDITQTGNTKIGTGGITTTLNPGGAVSLAVTGAILSGTGKITADNAAISTTAGMDIKTSVGTLSATSAAGNVTVLEDNGLALGTAGITAATGGVSLTLANGTLMGGGPAITGNSVALNLLQAGQAIDVDTSTSSLTASTKAGGNITIRNDRSVAIGVAGIVVGNTVADDVSLSVSSGAITGGAGSIKADAVVLSATSGITANTTVNSVTATSTAGNISLAQTGKSVALTSLTAANGGVTVTNNDTITVTSVQAIGTGKNVSLTASGINKKIVFGANSITADGDSVTLLSTGGLDGTSNAAVADITAKSVTLRSSGGDVTATVKAGTVVAAALGTDTDRVAPNNASKLDLTILGTSPVFVGTTSGLTVSAAGSVTLRTKDDPGGTGLPIVVVASPTASGGVTYVTDKTVTFAVTSVAATGAGSLSQSLTDAGSATVSGGGTTGVGFSTAITSPIRLASTLPITKQTTLDGTQRLNLATGTTVAGRAIDIDGSQLAGANTVGFNVSGTADNSVIRGFAFYGFNKANGVAVKLSPSADNVQIANNLFGISTGGQAVGNTVGISAAGSVGTPLNNLAITGNTVVRSTDAGILLGTNVTNAVVTGNLVGTNSARRALGNTGFGIDVSGAGAGNTIGGAGALANVVANNGVGVRVTNTTGGTTVRGNEILLNTTGILVNGTSSNVTIAGNTVTRNKADGVVVNGTSSNVTVGGALAADRNYIGTTPTSSLGLGNAFNGVVVSSTGAGNVVRNNRILGNGTSNSVDNNAGVKLTGNTANGVTVTGNTIDANRGAGILANRTGAGVATITANTIGSNFGSGVQVKSGTVVVGSAASEANAATIRANANTINSNARYGVEVLSGAFAQIAGNSMASNRLSGILNAALAAPTVTLATRNAANGTLTITVSGVTVGQVVHFYTGTEQGRTYLGRVAATGTTATLTMTLAEQIAARVSASVFVGAPVTATRTSTGANGQTSTFAATRSIVRV
jgi:hypothetical protein